MGDATTAAILEISVRCIFSHVTGLALEARIPFTECVTR